MVPSDVGAIRVGNEATNAGLKAAGAASEI
jgi:hypothetical protein